MIKLVQRELLSCEAIVRRAPNGELLLVCQCGDVTEPAPLNRVYVWHSRDDGENWSGRKLLVPEDGRAVYQTEVSVIGEEIRVYVTFHDGRFCKTNMPSTSVATAVIHGKREALFRFYKASILSEDCFKRKINIFYLTSSTIFPKNNRKNFQKKRSFCGTRGSM